MSYPSCHKQNRRRSSKVKRLMVKGTAIMNKIPEMVECHNNHYNTAEQVNRLDTWFYNSLRLYVVHLCKVSERITANIRISEMDETTGFLKYLILTGSLFRFSYG